MNLTNISVVARVSAPNDTYMGFVQHDVAAIAAANGVAAKPLSPEHGAGGPYPFEITGDAAAVENARAAVEALVYGS
ncbi:MAG: hypothetical protein JWN41_262 [Thermoleophilia bacterium]|nr:hypothetical protein [Thermoleophilia bacterium]